MDVVRLGVFTRSVVLEIARTTGQLAEAGLDVIEVPVPSSPAQFGLLRDGSLDAAFTSPDNVLAYRFLPSNPLGELLDVEIVAGIDRGLGLCIAARPGVATVESLAGGRLGVDVPNSGFAFVGFALLARHGLPRDEYETVTLGSTPQRADALLAGGCDATVLNAGNELRAAAAGCDILASVAELGPYLGAVVARSEQGMQRDAVDRLAAVIGEVSEGIRSGALQSEAIAAGERVLALDATLAAAHVAVLRDPVHGLVAGGMADIASLELLVELRREFLPASQLDEIVGALSTVVREDVLVP